MPFNLSRKKIHFCVDFQEKVMVYELRWPEPIELRDWHRTWPAKYKALERQSLEYIGRDTEACLALIDVLLEGVTSPGKTVTTPIDRVKQMLREPGAQPIVDAIINKGLVNVDVLEQEEREEDPQELDFAFAFRKEPVLIGYLEHEPEDRNNVMKAMKFHLAEADMTQSREYDRAQPFVRKRRGKMEQQQNVGVIQKLFETRCTKIENAVFDGTVGNATDEPDSIPCTEETKDQWIKLVPFHFISAVMMADKGVAEVGNA